jgi:hypothetical protein
MVKREASRGVSRRFLRAERLINRVRVAKADQEPFCVFRRLWYTPTYKFSALQGWRHGVHSRSLGGIPVICTRVETGISNREASCENNQGRDWDISQRVDLRRIPGRLVNPDRPPDDHYLALSEFRQGKFHLLMSAPAWLHRNQIAMTWLGRARSLHSHPRPVTCLLERSVLRYA